jgi:hypothetical protein
VRLVVLGLDLPGGEVAERFGDESGKLLQPFPSAYAHAELFEQVLYYWVVLIRLCCFEWQEESPIVDLKMAGDEHQDHILEGS